MSWEPELEGLRRREELARRMGGEERVARQHASGRLTSASESSGSSTTAASARPAPWPAARPTATRASSPTSSRPTRSWARAASTGAGPQGDDFTIRGGAADAAIWEKAVYAE